MSPNNKSQTFEQKLIGILRNSKHKIIRK